MESLPIVEPQVQRLRVAVLGPLREEHSMLLQKDAVISAPELALRERLSWAQWGWLRPIECKSLVSFVAEDYCSKSAVGREGGT